MYLSKRYFQLIFRSLFSTLVKSQMMSLVNWRGADPILLWGTRIKLSILWSSLAAVGRPLLGEATQWSEAQVGEEVAKMDHKSIQSWLTFLHPGPLPSGQNQYRVQAKVVYQGSPFTNKLPWQMRELTTQTTFTTTISYCLLILHYIGRNHEENIAKNAKAAFYKFKQYRLTTPISPDAAQICPYPP